MESSLKRRVALVAGATRGAGRGIVVELGAAGMTGRTSRQQRSEYDRPETVEETADLVSAAGGVGIPVQVDHADIPQVASLFARIEADEDGRLDVLVNDIWGGDPFLGEFTTPFWEQDLCTGLRVLHNGVDTHIITSCSLHP